MRKVENIAERRGPNRIREVLLERHPGAIDIPSETEIRNAITAMLVQVRKGQTVSLGGRRGRKGTFPAILEYILRHFINQNRTGLDVSHLKPVHALLHCKTTYQNEYKAQFPIADELMPPDSKIKQRFSALKTKLAKDRVLEEEFPAQPSVQ